MKPTVGLIVHYYRRDSLNRTSYEGPFAALVIAVDREDRVVLRVFFRGQDLTTENVGFEESVEERLGKGPGRYGTAFWCWPPRVG